MRGVWRSQHPKCDRNDVRLLAEIGQLRPHLLSPVQPREDRYQEVRALLFAREQLVRQRAALVKFARPEFKVLGHHLPSAGTKVFVAKCRSQVHASLRTAMDPVFDSIESACKGIETYLFEATDPRQTGSTNTSHLENTATPQNRPVLVTAHRAPEHLTRMSR